MNKPVDITRVQVELSFGASRAGVPTKQSFLTWINQAFLQAKPKGFAQQIGLSVRVADDQEARQLNAQYRNKDYATNVLSFPFERPPGVAKSYRQDWLGDLVIARDVIAKEAAEQGKLLRAHYAHMAVHGCLHLLGYDHIDPAEADVMERLETKILRKLGFADPYAD